MNTTSSALFVQALAELAAQFEIPELNAARINPIKSGSDDPREQGLTAEIDFAPKGQLSAIVRSATVTASVVPDEKTESLHYLRLEISYKLHGGGSNGNRRDFLMVTGSAYGSPTYKGLIDRDLFTYAEQALASVYKA